jgi:hypothetical protein
MNFVTNIAGAMMVSEAVKLLTKTGRVCEYPRAVDLNLYNHKIRVVHLYSPFRIETYRKILSRNRGKERFAAFIMKQKSRVGL